MLHHLLKFRELSCIGSSQILGQIKNCLPLLLILPCLPSLNIVKLNCERALRKLFGQHQGLEPCSSWGLLSRQLDGNCSLPLHGGVNDEGDRVMFRNLVCVPLPCAPLLYRLSPANGKPAECRARKIYPKFRYTVYMYIAHVSGPVQEFLV